MLHFLHGLFILLLGGGDLSNNAAGTLARHPWMPGVRPGFGVPTLLDLMRIVCLSDTHLAHERVKIKVPDGNILIHAGDGTIEGTLRELADFSHWLAHFHHKHKFLIAGNHDRLFQEDPALARRVLAPSITYLEDSTAFVRDLRIYGSPWQPEFRNWAFNLPRGPLLKAKWDLIPAGIDILVTHCPPAGILDQLPNGEHVGCEDLRLAVEHTKPKLHVFGHIHPAYGTVTLSGTTFVNASICDEQYLPVNRPVVIDL